jgi:hypothetical protein
MVDKSYKIITNTQQKKSFDSPGITQTCIKIPMAAGYAVVQTSAPVVL